MSDTSTDATFIYPQNGTYFPDRTAGNVNTYDTLDVVYESSWEKLNLTLFCLTGSTSSDYKFWNVRGNPILPSGTYEIRSIDSIGFNIYQYPTICHFKLTEYGNNSNALSGQVFDVVSEEGTSTTFRQSSTASGTTDSTQVATSGDVGTIATSRSVTATTSGSSTATSLPTQSVAAESSSGLSIGAKAGIGAGIAVVVVLIAALSAIVFVLRKKACRNKPVSSPDNVKEDKPELPAYSAVGHNESTRYYGSHEAGGSSRAEMEASQRQEKHTRPLELE